MIKFGTGGWRAVIGDDFTRENISLVAQAISEILIQDNKADKPVMIGFDRRFLSDGGTGTGPPGLCLRPEASSGTRRWFSSF